MRLQISFQRAINILKINVVLRDYDVEEFAFQVSLKFLLIVALLIVRKIKLCIARLHRKFKIGNIKVRNNSFQRQFVSIGYALQILLKGTVIIQNS